MPRLPIEMATLGTLAAATQVAYQSILNLGSRPVLDAVYESEAAYQSALSNQNTYDSNLVSARVTYNAAVAAQIAQEKIIINDHLHANQWIRVGNDTPLSNWGSYTAQCLSYPKLGGVPILTGFSPLFLMNNVTNTPVFQYPSLT